MFISRKFSLNIPFHFRSFSSALVMNVDILNRHSDFLIIFFFLLPIFLFLFLYFLGKESACYLLVLLLSLRFILWFHKAFPNQTKPQKVLALVQYQQCNL